MDDNISRQKATTAMWNEIVTRRMNGDEPMDEHRAEAILAGLPPVVAAEKTTGDNISRQALLKIINRVIRDGLVDTTGEHCLSAESVKAYVEALPPAEQRTGRWIFKEMGGKDGFRCSECGFFVPWDYEYYQNPHYIKNYKVCPHCIAKMEGE